MDIPHALLDSIRTGDVVLLLGAGASLGAKTASGQQAPTGPQLARMIAEKFLGGEHAEHTLPRVAELAISETDLRTVQNYIRDLFVGLEPPAFTDLLTTFKWTALATTNFDLLIETTYQRCDRRSQDLVPLLKNGSSFAEINKAPKNVMLMKLHGCITRTDDKEIPLILSTDQYINYKQHRSRLFEHLTDLAFEHPIVFIGHSLQDPDIRYLLDDIGQSEQRPRFYTVTPLVSGAESRFWENRRITPLVGTYEDFLLSLDSALPSVFRGVVPVPTESNLPISHRFTMTNPGLSDDCISFLDNDVDYVRTGMPTEPLDPRTFYKGVSGSWSGIEQDLDVRRDLEDSILLQTVLRPPTGGGPRFYVVKGHAGSGKSVFLQRLAWESATSYDKLCLFLRPAGHLSYGAVEELSRATGERIFLFADDVGEHAPELVSFIERARRALLDVTVIAAERINEWNMACEHLQPYVNDDYELTYLSLKEIDGLLSLLDRHRALYTLQSATQEQRRQAFVQRAGRQLLVALHEATLGKPFEDIIADEYSQITPTPAQVMYLGVCFMNRFHVPVRAGIVSRLYNIRFTEFKERFFQPLESVVFSRLDNRIKDYVYTTRHPHIAEIVVDRALTNPNQKLDLRLQMISALNVDYDADRTAFRKMVQARPLLDDLPDHQMASAVFAAAQKRVGDDTYLLHQMAIYDINRPNGNLQNAETLLLRARSNAPNDKTLVHSLAELKLSRAAEARTELERERFLAECCQLAKSLTGSSATQSHGYYTLAKAHLEKVRWSLSRAPDEFIQQEFNQSVFDVEGVIQEGLQRFPNDQHLLSCEFQLRRLLEQEERAMAALQSAFRANPHNPYTAVRLAKLLLSNGCQEEATDIYKQALESQIVDKWVHYNYARLLIDRNVEGGEEIEYHLRRSFTEGDANRDAQFWYARQLYLNGKVADANMMFGKLRRLPVDIEIKRQLQGHMRDERGTTRFNGTVVEVAIGYGFAARDGSGDRVYLHPKNAENGVWDQLRNNMRLEFGIGFNFWGATAINIALV